MMMYRLLWLLLSPFLVGYFCWRLWQGKEDTQRFTERFGLSNQRRPKGQLLWLHGASVGECVSLLPLLKELRHTRPELNLLLTSGTVTSAKLMAERLQDPELRGVIHQYVPLDAFPFVRWFLAHWRPSLSIFVESEFWPELLTQAPNPILLNARISDKSFTNYKKFRWFYRPLLRRFLVCLTQREADAKRLKQLGAPHAVVGGNLKLDAPPLQADAAVLDVLRQTIGERPVLVAASTHPGEEEQMIALHQQLQSRHPHLLTILIPRHPHRGEELALQHKIPARSLGKAIKADTSLYLADTLGELGLWYQLADVVVMGGSWVPHGGQNPLEPLKLGTVTLTGPHMFNFVDMVPQLAEEGMLHVTKTLAECAEVIQSYLNDKNKLAMQQQKILNHMTTLQGATRASVQHILQQLDAVSDAA